MRFITILLLCLLLPPAALLASAQPGTAETDTLSEDKEALRAAAFDCLNRNRLDRDTSSWGWQASRLHRARKPTHTWKRRAHWPNGSKTTKR